MGEPLMRDASAVKSILCGLLHVALAAAAIGPASAQADESLAERGYRLLTTKPYLTPDFDQQTFDELWKTSEEPLRSQAEAATLDERRRMAFSRYGLTLPPGESGPVAMQYVDDGQ